MSRFTEAQLNTELRVAYSPLYQQWQLGKGHPSDPVRAEITMKLLRHMRPELVELDPGHETWSRCERLLKQVHTPEYVDWVLQGHSAEWRGTRRELSDAAAVMFMGTVRLMESLEARGWTPSVSFNPQGAKHHAHADHSSGFCVFNDMAWAALYALDAGLRVAYLDIDAHHGDGVEAICRPWDAVTTYSVHNGDIFPGTGHESHADAGAYNYPLERGSGDGHLLRAVNKALSVFDNDTEGVDILLMAIGADGLSEDPLGGLEYTVEGLYEAAQRVAEWASLRGVPMVVGGAGGYTPRDLTPLTWAGQVVLMQEAYDRARDLGIGPRHQVVPQTTH